MMKRSTAIIGLLAAVCLVVSAPTFLPARLVIDLNTADVHPLPRCQHQLFPRQIRRATLRDWLRDGLPAGIELRPQHWDVTPRRQPLPVPSAFSAITSRASQPPTG